jgi:predicted transcriptional regulator
MSDKRLATITFRIRSELKLELEKLASADHRSLSSFLQLVLEAHVARTPDQEVRAAQSTAKPKK